LGHDVVGIQHPADHLYFPAAALLGLGAIGVVVIVMGMRCFVGMVAVKIF
jgi:hypothetical protein